MNVARLKVLAVDKEQLMLCALERAFKSRSFDIKTASTPEQALEEVESSPFDLFLLELDMQDQSCLKLLEAIDEYDPYIPIIFMASSVMGSSELGDVIRSIRKHGAWHLLEKPFSLDKMLCFVSVIFNDHDGEMFGMNSLNHNYEQENRDQFRRSHVLPVHFSYFSIVDGVSVRIQAKGILTDICEYGSGILAHVPMQSDQVVCFDNDFPKQNGIVAWSSMIEDETCRFGVKFY
jgi:CheY-like chemotaxis protein